MVRISFFWMAFVAGVSLFCLVNLIEAQDSCVGKCLTSGSAGNCYCDDKCSQFGNCCEDFIQECANETLCQNRCFAGYSSNLECQCNNQCWLYGNCCEDYHEYCVPGSCVGRCGERNTTTSSCQCDGDCTNENDCCEDFFDTCTTDDSCKNLCGSTYDGKRSCQCTDDCAVYGNCCEDHETMCPVIDEYSCANRCGMKESVCSCQESCVTEKNCCTDYEQACNNGTSWLDDECTPDEEMLCPLGFDTPPVILFSMDGFRNSYLYRNITPNIWKLASCGVHSPYTRSVYPTKTFPNHYTIATGLYPESHGIVSNTFFDHDIGEEFRLGAPNSADPHWWGGEPIWVTASNQGLKSASYFWVGSDVNITRYPDYYYKFDSSVPDQERIYQVLRWLDLPAEDRPSIITAYIEDVDGAGHSGGPDGAQVNMEIEKADNIIGMLMDGLKARNLDKCVNFILLADHGMASRSCDRVSYVDIYGVNTDVVYFNGGPVGTIGKSEDPTEWDQFDAVDLKNKLQCKRDHAHFQAFLKQEYMPKRLHYAFNDRIDDVQLVLDDEWIVGGKTGTSTSCSGGTHGWDNEDKAMRAVFVAHGAYFKRQYNTSEGFDNYEIYNLICDMLDLNPAPNNGTRASLNHLLVHPKSYIFVSSPKEANECSYSANGDLPADRKGCPTCEDEASSNSRFDITSDVANAYKEQHILTGIPEISTSDREDVDFCHLYQQEYVTTYDWNKKMPYYTSFVLEKLYRDMMFWSFCARPDVRIPEQYSSSCGDYDGSYDNDITASFLFHPMLSNRKSDATILSNTIPVYKAFVPVWEEFSRILHRWSLMYNGISVVVGPVFDYDFDGRADSMETIKKFSSLTNPKNETVLVIPTHVFAVITRCKNQNPPEAITGCSNDPENIEVLSFVIPNYQQLPCQYGESIENWVPRTILEHVARVRDVELLTDTLFFPDWVTKQGVLQSTLINALRLRTRLPEFGSSWLSDLVEVATPSPEDVPTAPPFVTTTTTSYGSRAEFSILSGVVTIALGLTKIFAC